MRTVILTIELEPNFFPKTTLQHNIPVVK